MRETEQEKDREGERKKGWGLEQKGGTEKMGWGGGGRGEREGGGVEHGG